LLAAILERCPGAFFVPGVAPGAKGFVPECSAASSLLTKVAWSAPHPQVVAEAERIAFSPHSTTTLSGHQPVDPTKHYFSFVVVPLVHDQRG
jgi:hypothetical protein